MIEGLCQELRSSDDFPYKQDWIVKRVLRYDSAYYPVQVIGINTNYEEGEYGSHFSWRLPLPLSWRYDLTDAEIEE